VKNIRVAFKDSYGIIRNEREAHQVHAKGFVGEPLSGGGLKLEPVELCYLLSKGTVDIYLKKGKKPFAPPEFLLRCQQLDEGFDKRFKVYREIRDRGFFIKIDENYLNVFQPTVKNVGRVPYAKVLCFGEDEELEPRKLLNELRRFHRLGIVVLGAVADAEGDVTFFRFEEFDDEGGLELRKAHLDMMKELGDVVAARDEGNGGDDGDEEGDGDDGNNDRNDVGDRGEGIKLTFSFSNEKGQCYLTSSHPGGRVEDIIHSRLFFGKPFTSGLTLGFYEGLYLAKLFKRETKIPWDNIQIVWGNENHSTLDFPQAREQLDSRLYTVYNELKERWLVPKTGFKYGSHFRVYKKLAEGHHAEYLLHMVDEERVPWFWLEVMVRLATGVKKEMVLAFEVEGKGKETKRLRFLKVVRELPSPGKRDGS